MSHPLLGADRLDYAGLRAALTPSAGALRIDHTTLTPNIAELIDSAYLGQPVVITGAVFEPDDGRGEVLVLRGFSTFLNVADLPVELRAAVDSDGHAQLLLRYALLGDAPGPNDWRFSRSFPTLPAVMDWSGMYRNPTTIPLDRLDLFDACYVVASQPQTEPVSGVALRPGINFVSKLRPTGVVGIIASTFGHHEPFALHGTIRIPGQAETTPPLRPFQYPWDLETPPPGILLQADLGAGASVRRLEFKEIVLRLYSPTRQDWLDGNPTFLPWLGYSGTLAVPSAGLELHVVAPMEPGADKLLLLGSFRGVTLGKLAHLADVVGAGDLLEKLPDGIRKAVAALARLELTHAGLELGLPATGVPELGWASVTVGFPELKWKVWDDHVVIDSVACRFDVSDPFHAATSKRPDVYRRRQLGVCLTGRTNIEEVPVNITASNADDFTVYASLGAKQTIPLKRLLETYAPGIPAPGDLTVNSLAVAVGPGRSYSMAAALAQKPEAWVLDVGFQKLSISDVVLALNYPQGGPASGTFGGTIGFGDAASLRFRYDVPGDFVVRGDLPSVKLSKLIARLTNQPVKLPRDLDLDFVDSSVLIREVGKSLVFRFGTEVEKFGTFALEVRKVDGKWGFAAGFDLSAGKASGVAGLGPLQRFEKMFGLQKLLLVVSTFDDPAFAFPDVAAFNNPRISAKKITLPAQAVGGLKAGLNLYGQWVIDKSDPKQRLLQKFLGRDPTLDVALQVGPEPAKNARLAVACNTRVRGMPLSCMFGAQMKNGEPMLFLTGSLTAKIQRAEQEFKVEMLFVSNGAFLSGTMQGAKPIDFEVFKLGNLALEVGITWEGLPSLGVAGTIEAGFQSAIAVFFDAANPSKSMVAGSLSDLTLRDVLEKLTGAKSSPIDAVLKTVAIKGTQGFEIDGALAGDLDNLKLDRVADAFAKAKVKIPSSPEQVFLVRDRSGKKWYLTDLTNKARHYQLVKRNGKIAVSTEAQFYCAPQDTAIGNPPTFKQGFYLNGAIEYFGLGGSATIEISKNQGIAVDGEMKKIVIGNETLFCIKAAKGDGGPAVSAATFARNGQGPHFYLNGKLEMLGLSDTIVANVTKDGAEFELKGDLIHLVHFDVQGRFGGRPALDVGGRVSVGIGKIKIKWFKINLGTIGGDLCIQVSGKDITARLDFDFTVPIIKKHLHLPINLDVRTKAFTNLVSLVKDAVIDALRRLFTAPKPWAEAVAAGYIEGVDDIEQALRDRFGLSAAEAKAIATRARKRVATARARKKVATPRARKRVATTRATTPRKRPRRGR